MNLIARCPACTTVFRVLPDQLKVSAGWVRCGRCETVFDAQLHQIVAVQRANASLTSATSFPASTAHNTEPIVKANPAWPQVVFHRLAPEPAAIAPRPTSNLTEPTAAGPNLNWDLRVEPTTENPTTKHAVPQWESAPSHTISTASATSIPGIATASTLEAVNSGAEQVLNPHLEQHILQQAKQQAFWRQNWVRALLGLMGAGLTLLLASQIAAFERQTLLTHFPQSYSALQALCKLAPCDPSPPTLASSLVLESFNFVRINTTDKTPTYLLQWSVHNNAEHPVAAPALELSLTDAYDRTQVRRVLSATELGLTTPELGGGQTWQGQMQFRLDMPRQATPITNYGLQVFYP